MNSIEKDWTTEAGLRAVVLLTEMGHRCGYVGIPATHPLHGVEYNEQTPALKPNLNRSVEKMSPVQVMVAALNKEGDDLNSPEYVFEVHGGLTFSGGSDDYPAASDGLWWFCYDCAHAGDLPEPESKMGRMYAEMGFVERTGSVRTLYYCTAECELLAKQIAEVAV